MEICQFSVRRFGLRDSTCYLRVDERPPSLLAVVTLQPLFIELRQIRVVISRKLRKRFHSVSKYLIIQSE